jgi:hypothetical protein
VIAFLLLLLLSLMQPSLMADAFKQGVPLLNKNRLHFKLFIVSIEKKQVGAEVSFAETSGNLFDKCSIYAHYIVYQN